jgi:chemosensory pili system protein ChpA (sensor histidine kinase/response regulator)
VFGEFGHVLGEIEGQISRQVRLASEVEDKLMRLRMVPLSTITAKLERAARTSATTAGKRAEFALDGERTGLDKTVLEAMADPLLHLVRNAVDHGLEPPEVRLALGKAAHGTITLRGRHEGSHVVLSLSDDGRGIDFEAVRAAVARRGLASPEEAESLSPTELADYLFRPGFSTRDEVSELSGRGVGLDVVKSRVEALKGTVVIASTPGGGTTFTIRLPMTLAVVRALLVKAGTQTFAIPLEAVEQILRPGDGDTDRVGRDPVLRLKSGVCPLVPLARVLTLRHTAEAEGRPPVVVLNAGGRRVGVQIDKLVGGREVVIKARGRQLRHVSPVSGASLLGDGSVVLILNPAELTRTQAAPQQAAPRAAAARPRDGTAVLVVDDSPSVRRVLTMLLGGAGWQVTTAKDGVEAFDILQRGEVPDVVLTDVEMPRMDGYELLATIRGQAAVSHLPVAVLTSRSADKHRRKALDLGASAYVVKPYQDENLLEILRHLARPVRAGG